MPDISDLYPRPPAASTNALSMNPKEAIGAALGITQLQALQRDQASRQATGAAFQGALDDDGNVDMGKLSTALRSNPDAAYGMPETTDRMLTQHTAQTALAAKQNLFLVDALGAVANDPKLDRDKVRNMAVTLARNLKLDRW
jgi:hypothetical protein